MRDVRPGDSFTRQLTAALASSQGAITRRHFDTYVYPQILRRFAVGWDEMDYTGGNPQVRTIVEPFYPLHAVAVSARELPSGVIELISILIDWVGLVDPDEVDG